MYSSGLIQTSKNPSFCIDLARDNSLEVNMQPYPISDPVGRPVAEKNARLAWFNPDLESSFSRWVTIHSFVEKDDPELSGYVFDDSLLLVSFVDEKGNGTS
jgi:hypothetical protein